MKKERTISQISKLESKVLGKKRIDSINYIDEIVNNILEVNDNQSLILEKHIIPQQEKYRDPGTGRITSEKFMKHAPDIKPRRYRSLTEIKKIIQDFSEEILEKPIDHIRKAYSEAKHYFYSGYTFKPFYGNDRRTRKVSLTECIKGTILYCENTKSNIKVKPYSHAKRVRKDGAGIIVEIGSRTNKEKYKLRFYSIPIANDIMKWANAYRLKTDHTCELKRYRNLNYQEEESNKDSDIINFCAHEIAAYLSIIDYYYNSKDKNIKNPIPYKMSPFLIPTQKAINLFLYINNNIIIRKTHDGTDKINKKTFRHLYDAETEIIFNALIKKVGFDELFKPLKGTKIRDYTL